MFSFDNMFGKKPAAPVNTVEQMKKDVESRIDAAVRRAVSTKDYESYEALIKNEKFNIPMLSSQKDELKSLKPRIESAKAKMYSLAELKHALEFVGYADSGVQEHLANVNARSNKADEVGAIFKHYSITMLRSDLGVHPSVIEAHMEYPGAKQGWTDKDVLVAKLKVSEAVKESGAGLSDEDKEKLRKETHSLKHYINKADHGNK